MSIEPISSPLTPSLPEMDQIVVSAHRPSPTYDVAIVGGGIVGATLACALQKSGLQVVIIESQPLPTAAGRRQAYALSLLSGLIFQNLGVWSDILPKINTFYQISLSDADYQQIVKFNPDSLGTFYEKQNLAHQPLGYVGEHRVILTALQDFLANCSHSSWLCPATVDQVDYQTNQVAIKIKLASEQGESTQVIYSKLIVAADGARSPLRQAAGIKTHGWKYWQSCISMTIKTEKPHNNVAFERFWPTGPMGVLPLPGNRCQVVWTAPHAEAERLKELDQREFLALLEKRTGGLLGKLELESDRFLFKVQLMQSDRYIKPRLALIGDAAHCCHPVGGQGLNLGIRDAAALAEILTAAHQNNEDIGEPKILKRYESWRQKENLVILGFTDFLDRIFSNNWLPIVALRRLGLWCLQNIPPIKSLALRLMTGLLGRHPDGVSI